jgi:threonine dehydratase
LSPKTLIIGVEPAGAPAMFESIKQDKIVTLNQIDSFVDGAAVKKVGEINFPIVKKTMSKVLLVDEGKVCHTLLQLYNDEGFVVEPAGTLSIAALDDIKEEIKGKTVVCIVSGSNNDITRTEEIRERALLYNGLKHYFVIRFPQRAGALREFLNHVLGPNDDITHFEYTKRNNRELGPALVGIQVKCKEDYDLLLQRMTENGLQFQSMNESKMLYELLI